MAAQQLAFSEAAHAGQIIRCLFNIQNPQCTRHFIEQSRHIIELCMVPMCFNKRHEALAGLREVRGSLFQQNIQNLAGFRTWQ